MAESRVFSTGNSRNKPRNGHMRDAPRETRIDSLVKPQLKSLHRFAGPKGAPRGESQKPRILPNARDRVAKLWNFGRRRPSPLAAGADGAPTCRGPEPPRPRRLRRLAARGGGGGQRRLRRGPPAPGCTFSGLLRLETPPVYNFRLFATGKRVAAARLPAPSSKTECVFPVQSLAHSHPCERGRERRRGRALRGPKPSRKIPEFVHRVPIESQTARICTTRPMPRPRRLSAAGRESAKRSPAGWEKACATKSRSQREQRVQPKSRSPNENACNPQRAGRAVGRVPREGPLRTPKEKGPGGAFRYKECMSQPSARAAAGGEQRSGWPERGARTAARPAGAVTPPQPPAATANSAAHSPPPRKRSPSQPLGISPLYYSALSVLSELSVLVVLARFMSTL